MFDFFKKKLENKTSEPENNTEVQNVDAKTEKKGFFSLTFENLKKTLEKTSESLVGNIVQQIEQEEEFDEFILDDMEELLIEADLGVNTASFVVDSFPDRASCLVNFCYIAIKVCT